MRWWHLPRPSFKITVLNVFPINRRDRDCSYEPWGFVCFLFGTILALSQVSAYLLTQTSFGKLKGSNLGYVLRCLKTACCCERKRTHELYKLPLSTFHSPFHWLFFFSNRLHCLERGWNSKTILFDMNVNFEKFTVIFQEPNSEPVMTETGASKPS